MERRFCLPNDPKFAFICFGAFWICNKVLSYGQLTINFSIVLRTTNNSKSRMRKIYTDDNFRIIGQARSSFHLGVLESAYIKTQNTVLCRQKEFRFSLGFFKYIMLIGSNWSHLRPIRRILTHKLHLEIYFGQPFGHYSTFSYSDECQRKKAFKDVK